MGEEFYVIFPNQEGNKIVEGGEIVLSTLKDSIVGKGLEIITRYFSRFGEGTLAKVRINKPNEQAIVQEILTIRDDDMLQYLSSKK